MPVVTRVQTMTTPAALEDLAKRVSAKSAGQDVHHLTFEVAWEVANRGAMPRMPCMICTDACMHAHVDRYIRDPWRACMLKCISFICLLMQSSICFKHGLSRHPAQRS